MIARFRLITYLFSLILSLTSALPVQAENIYTVVRVIDGDTIEIKYKDKIESVRLIGIDTPESRANKKAWRDAKRSGRDIRTITKMGKQAVGYVKTLVKGGDEVKIEFDVQKRDKYKRLLGYVYLRNGKMLNEEIIIAGYASPMTIPPDVKYQDKFLNAYKEARKNKRGIWK
ncbi:MAG: thermonuclease family protein [Candidatus Ancaeobacter aquaticus]|nr:thermonuclease family protein [Candidatus Ancaeobacter aquaticus]